MRVNIVCLPDPASAERVAKTGPTPEAPHSRPGDLPEDVIREIIKHLTDSEALQLSTLSKTFHATFPPRPTNIACKSYRKAVSLRKRLVHSTNGAIHLVSLDIRCTGLVATDVPVICDILAEAHNLRSLTCGPLEIGSPKVRNRIQSLPHLAQLQIHKPSKSALNAMVYPQSLSSLRLIQNTGEISWSDLGRKLAGLTRLTKLVLDRCPMDDPGLYGDLDVDGADAPIPLPSVTSLEVYSTDLPIEISYFARMFPSLDTLHLEDSMFPSEDRRHPDASNRTLHKLTYLSSKESASEISWEVRHLATSVLKNTRLYLDSICTPDNLVGLYMRLPLFTLDHWNKRVDEFIPEVHILELESFQADFPNTLRFFAELYAKHNPEIYGEHPVQVLSIAGPQPLSRSNLRFAPVEELRARLFEQAAYALPNLRYLALANPPHIPQAFSDLSGERALWRWWRIIRSGEDVEFREIPIWEGERVREYFRNADREKAEKFVEKFIALR